MLVAPPIKPRHAPDQSNAPPHCGKNLATLVTSGRLSSLSVWCWAGRFNFLFQVCVLNHIRCCCHLPTRPQRATLLRQTISACGHDRHCWYGAMRKREGGSGRGHCGLVIAFSSSLTFGKWLPTCIAILRNWVHSKLGTSQNRRILKISEFPILEAKEQKLRNSSKSSR